MKEAKIIRHHFEEYRAYLILNSVLPSRQSRISKKAPPQNSDANKFFLHFSLDNSKYEG
jgi:hypothetical protein